MPAKAREFTDKQRAEISNAGFLTQSQIAGMLEINYKTYQRMLEKDPIVMSIYKKQKAEKIKLVIGSLMDNILKGDPASTFFFLKTQAGWRENQQNRTLKAIEKIVALKEKDMLTPQEFAKLVTTTLESEQQYV